MIQMNTWTTSSRSNGTGGNNCVKVIAGEVSVMVRDSKDENGPNLCFTPAEWTAFVEGVKNGEFDLDG